MGRIGGGIGAIVRNGAERSHGSGGAAASGCEVTGGLICSKSVHRASQGELQVLIPATVSSMFKPVKQQVNDEIAQLLDTLGEVVSGGVRETEGTAPRPLPCFALTPEGLESLGGLAGECGLR